jgi:hypothetical protein
MTYDPAAREAIIAKRMNEHDHNCDHRFSTYASCTCTCEPPRINDYYQMEQDRKTPRVVSRSTDGATGRRDDSGRDCKDCGATFAPTYGERYCSNCAKGKDW